MTDILESVLGTSGATFIKTTDWLVTELDRTRYSYMNAKAYKDLMIEDRSEGMKIYWTEILYRAHFASATSLVRSRRWVDGILTGYEESNFLVNPIEAAVRVSVTSEDVVATTAVVVVDVVVITVDVLVVIAAIVESVIVVVVGITMAVVALVDVFVVIIPAVVAPLTVICVTCC
jgi:hypothetical protein